jgi:hypothetical protein
MIGVKNAARELKNKGMDEELQVKIDKACVVPHIHPRRKRNKPFVMNYSTCYNSYRF